MTVKLIATDMDGTFLDNHGEYDRPRFMKIYRELQQRQIKFVIASNHPAVELARVFQDYPAMWLIGSNGAELMNTQAGLSAETFSPTVLTEILAALAAYPEIQVALCGTQTVHVLQNAEPQFKARFQNEIELVNEADLSAVTDPVVKFVIGCGSHKTAQLVYELTPKLSGLAVPMIDRTGCIELIQPGMHKGRALKRLGQQLHIDPADMVAFGDDTNDLEMLHYVKTAVAVQNAPANVQANTIAVTGTNADGGVLNYIEQHVLKKQD